MSESHSRQMKLFAENPGQYISDYSKEFEKAFLQLCKLKGKRVKANMVYNELIANRSHTHMNATHWVTLTAFVQYLGKSGKCRVDYTEKGWFIEFIDTSPLAQKRARAAQRNSKLSETRDQIETRMIEEQINRANEGAEEKSDSENEEDRAFKPENGGKLGFSLQKGVKLENESAPLKSVLKQERNKRSSQSDEERGGRKRGRSESIKVENSSSRRRTKSRFSDTKPPVGNVSQRHFTKSSKKRKRGQRQLEHHKLMIEMEKGKRYPVGWSPAVPESQTNGGRSNGFSSSSSGQSSPKKSKMAKKREKSWVRTGIVVKIMNKKIGHGAYFKQKGTITEVPKKFEALVRLKNGAHLQIDQTMLETVLPALNKRVAVLVGEHEGKIGVIRGIDETAFKAEIDIPDAGNVYISFDHVCKMDKTFV